MINPGDADGHADYLRACGLDVIEREDGMIEVEGSVVKDGKVAYLVVDPDDVSNIIGDVYRANTTIEEVFDQYVEERVFREKEE